MKRINKKKEPADWRMIILLLVFVLVINGMTINNAIKSGVSVQQVMFGFFVPAFFLSAILIGVICLLYLAIGAAIKRIHRKRS